MVFLFTEGYGVVLSVGSLRKITAALAETLAPWREACQVARVLQLHAFSSRGRFRPSLVVGRDGVMMPMRPCWEEASTATLSVYDRRGQRLGTVYLGQMPRVSQDENPGRQLNPFQDLCPTGSGFMSQISNFMSSAKRPSQTLWIQGSSACTSMNSRQGSMAWSSRTRIACCDK